MAWEKRMHSSPYYVVRVAGSQPCIYEPQRFTWKGSACSLRAGFHDFYLLILRELKMPLALNGRWNKGKASPKES